MAGKLKNLIMILAVSLLVYSCAGRTDTSGEQFVQPYRKAKDASLGQAGRANAFVSPSARHRIYRKVAVMPFQAPIELAGASIADMFATELLKTYKYQLIERSQMENVLSEQALGLKGVTDSVLAVEVGKILGVQGVIVGTVPEYGQQAVGEKKLPAIGINIRMIDVVDGNLVWSVTNSGTSGVLTSLSSFAETIVRLSVDRLEQEWIRAGDTLAVNFPSPEVVSSKGGIRSAAIEILADSPQVFTDYVLLRSNSREGPFEEIARITNSGRKRVICFEDSDLLDSEIYQYKIEGMSGTGLKGPPAGPIEILTVGPPETVVGFEAESGLIRKVALKWIPQKSPYLRGYDILRSSHGGNWSRVARLNNSADSSYEDKKLEDQTEYAYRIHAVNLVEVESPPAYAEATTKGPPSPVEGLAATTGEARQVTIAWNAVREPEIDGYVIFRASSEGGPFEKISEVKGRDTTTYVDKGRSGFWPRNSGDLENNKRYFYKIRSVNVVDVHSEDSPVVSAVTKPVPVAVRSVRAGQHGVKQVGIDWQMSIEKDIKAYHVFRGDSPANVSRKVAEVPSDQPHYMDKGLEDGTTYYYQVRAVDGDGLFGKLSEVVSSRTKPVPAKPEGLHAELDNGTVILTWNANPESDIDRYRVFQCGFLRKELLGETGEQRFVINPEKGGTIRLKVRAVDMTDLEGEDSEEIVIIIPK